MKMILLLGMSTLSGCALGVFGPEAQERAQERLAEAKADFARAREQFAQAGQQLGQVADNAARAYGTYAQGYAQGYQAYQQNVPVYRYQTGMINRPIGQGFPSTYSVDSNGNGMILPPIGDHSGPILFHVDNAGNVWQY